MYWVYRSRTFYWHSQPVQAKLYQPDREALRNYKQAGSFRSPMQIEPYGVDFKFTYLVNPKHPFPDHYVENYGFSLYSARLVSLLESFQVKAETFPTRLVDSQGQEGSGQAYSVFHLLEGVLPAMDEQRSQWTGDANIGIPKLVINLEAFEHRPMFTLNHLFLPMIRDDVKKALQHEKITGFEFLRPEHYHSGKFGMLFEWDE